MKRLALIVFIVFSSIYCSKDAKTCWKCTQTTNVSTYSYGSWTASQPTTSVTSQCDKTSAEIEDLKKHGSSDRTTTNQRVVTIMSCDRQ